MSTEQRTLALKLAATADVDPRTALKALTRGIASVRGRAAEKLSEAAHSLGARFPSDPPPPGVAA